MAKDTQHPDPRYRGGANGYKGQCAPLTYAQSIVTLWASDELDIDPDGIRFEVGEIYTADDMLLDDFHTWTKVISGEDERITDHTPLQYVDINPDPDGHMHIALQAKNNPVSEGVYPLINRHAFTTPVHRDHPLLYQTSWRHLSVPNARSLKYVTKRSVPIMEFDPRELKGRAERWLGKAALTPYLRLGNVDATMPGIHLSKFWYHDNWDFEEEGRAERLLVTEYPLT